MSMALAVIAGTTLEKVEAFKQLGAVATTGMFPSGYDSALKVIAASWCADALGVHPVVYMQGVYPLQIQGKNLSEPRWEFLNGLLRARLPGFDFKVLVETDDECKIEMWATGRERQTVKYTMDDAKRQGFDRKDTYKSSGREMLFKQCFKRAAKRLGSDVLMGMTAMLSAGEDGDEPIVPAPRRTLGEIMGDKPEAPKVIDWRASFKAAVFAYYGKVSGKKLLEVARLAEKQRTGNEAPWKALDEIGPADAETLWRWFNEKYPDKVTDATIVLAVDASKPAGGEVVMETTGSTEAAQPQEPNHAAMVAIAASAAAAAAEQTEGWSADPVAPIQQDDDPPPVEEQEVVARADDAVPDPEPEKPRVGWTELLAVVVRARKAFGRKFVNESPVGSRKFWLVDADLLDMVFGNHAQGRLLMKEGVLDVNPQIIVELHSKVSDMVAQHEATRGRS